MSRSQSEQKDAQTWRWRWFCCLLFCLSELWRIFPICEGENSPYKHMPRRGPRIIHMQMSKLPGCRHKRKRHLCHLTDIPPPRHPTTHIFHPPTLPPIIIHRFGHRRVLADFVCAGMKIVFFGLVVITVLPPLCHMKTLLWCNGSLFFFGYYRS